MESDKSIDSKMLDSHTYPSPGEEDFQSSLYKKREFSIHAIPERPQMKTYEEIKEYRDDKCARSFKLNEYQSLLSNFINPNTPYKGVLIYHGTGTGKSCAAIAIAEKFKPMVEKYGVKIHVLVPGPLNKQNFMSEILKCTNETYLKSYLDKTILVDENEMAKIKKNAMNIVSQYYRIMSYKSFYKKVLGEKIVDKTSIDGKTKSQRRKTESGEYERDVSIDRIYNLDNTILIVDEAHNITGNSVKGNEYGKAVRKIIECSKNIRLVLLSATPMKNAADDIIPLLNYIRPLKYPIERDQVFNSYRNHLMDFKPGGEEYLRKMSRGYVSFLRGADPLTFAERVDMGVVPPGLSFTKVTRCFMEKFQLESYKHVIATYQDSLEKKSGAVANFVFPGLSSKGNSIVGFYGIDGISEIKKQLKNNAEVLTNKILSVLPTELKSTDPNNLMYLNENGMITGDIFKQPYLKYFSIKFYEALNNLNTLVYGKRAVGIAFVFSNLVKVGIELFQEVLNSNGYLEYQENMSSYQIKPNTRCYFCGHNHADHKAKQINIPKHEFYPATYVAVTGKSDDNADQIPEEKHRILKNIFNNVENKDGKYIKVVLGSKVMNEGITLRNVKEAHILDVHFNLGKVDQAIGRAIRFCTHYDVTNESNVYPAVEIFKYVVSLEGELSTEEELYRKAELKYKLVNKVGRVLQEEAIDCPLNRNGNVFAEELKKYANCGTDNNPCPAVCGYMSCDFKCGEALLNAKYYDPEKNIYKRIQKAELDYSTYNNSLASEEIEYAKSKIKELFKLEFIYNLEDILKYVKKSYPLDKRELFDDFFVYQALDDLIPTNNNAFNNFKDTVLDKYNRSGYLIYRKNRYIFQPFDENENLPMYYRRKNLIDLSTTLHVKDYIQNKEEYKNYKSVNTSNNADNLFVTNKYDFDSIQDYYDNRDEFEYVGIIDQESTRKKVGSIDIINDEFKIRQRRPKVLMKKRETGIPSFKGAVCKTAKDKEFLQKLAKKLDIKLTGKIARNDICNSIRDRMFDLEKYSTGNDKITYLIVPANHPNIPFPLNLEDRIDNIIESIKKEIRVAVKYNLVKTKTAGQYSDIKYISYEIIFDNTMDKYADVLTKFSAKKIDKNYVIKIE